MAHGTFVINTENQIAEVFSDYRPDYFHANKSGIFFCLPHQRAWDYILAVNFHISSQKTSFVVIVV
jgi:hypothetical protein